MENERDEESRRRLLNDNEGRRRRSIWGRLKSQAMAMGLSRRNMAVVAGPVTCMLVYRYAELGEKSGAMVGALCWIFMWWMTEAVPMAVTSLAPLYLFPLLGIRKADSVAKSYMNDVIALVIGSFMLAIAVEEYGIHRRLALHMVLAFTGKKVSPPLLLLGFTGATAFVSMWMHNVAAAVMMMPVATGFLVRLMGAHDSSSSSSSSSSACEKGCGAGLEGGLNMVQREGEIVHRDLVMFCKAIVLGVTYGAAIGGMSTLTGTGVNLILVGMWQSYFPSAEPISFMEWSLFAFPVAFVMFLCLWGILCLLYCSTTCAKSLSGFLDKSHLKMELDSLGPMSFAEKMVLSLFSVLIILWMTKSITDDIPGWGDLFHGYPGDGTASVMIATLLFIIPNKKSAGEKLMDWNKCKKLPWNIILLLGAGFAIADGVRKSGLADLMSRNLDFLESVPYLAMAPVVVVLSSSLTEFASNNATTTLFVPLLIQVALSMHLHPLFLMIPGAIGAQYSYLLPTGTPSNTVGFTTGYIDMSDMFKVGIPLKIAGIATISLFMPTLGAYVFGSKPVGT